MHWAQMQEAGSLTGMRFLLRIYRVCGRWPFRFLLFFVLLWFYARRRIAREASRDYLQRLHRFSDGATPMPTRRNVFRHFLTFSEIMLDKLLSIGDANLLDDHRVDGIEYLDTLLKQKRGGIFVTAHLGNTDLCRKLGERYVGMRMTVLVHTKHAARFNQMLKEIDPNNDIDLLQVTDIDIGTAITLAQRVESGGFIVIAGDRVPVNSATTVRIPFLGSEASFPISPYVLATILQCPLLAVFGVRHHDSFVIFIRQIAESVSLPRRGRETAIIPYATAFARLLEAECLKTPFQWSNFYPFWALSAPLNIKETR